MSRLTLESLGVRLGGCAVVEDVSLTIATGECVGLIGPNGAGKSSLMRAALGLLPSTGRSSLASLPVAERARTASWLPQQREIAWGMTVADLVALGRLPYRRPGAPLTEADRQAVAEAMRAADVRALQDRPAMSLSGGEQARVLLARVLAQDTPIILADEPVAALDPAHQIATMETFADRARQGGTVVTALHDLGLAARWCSRLILMNAGRVVADGPPGAVLTEERLRAVYGIRAHVTRTPDGLIIAPVALSGP